MSHLLPNANQVNLTHPIPPITASWRHCAVSWNKPLAPSVNPYEPVPHYLLLLVHSHSLIPCILYLPSSTHRSTYQHWPLPKQHNHFFAIFDPSQIAYTVPEEQHEAINDNWENQEAWENKDGWNHADNWNKQETQPQLHTAEWIYWMFNHININQIREIAGHLFAQNFRNQFEEANRFPFHANTPHPSIPELKGSTIEEEEEDQWEINTNNEILSLGNFENTE